MLKRIHRKIVKLLIFNVSIIPKNKIPNYDSLNNFLRITINSNKGQFNFNFKKTNRTIDGKRTFFTKQYFVDLEAPEGLDMKKTEIVDNVLFVVKISPFCASYTLIAGILMDLYLDNFLKDLKHLE